MRVGGDQLLGDFGAQAIHQGALELALEVGADFLAELVQLAALTPKLLMKASSTSGRTARRPGHLERDLGGLAGQCGTRQSAGKVTSTSRSSPAFMPISCDFELGEHRRRADHGGALLDAFGRQALVAGGGEGFHIDQVAGLRRARRPASSCGAAGAGFRSCRRCRRLRRWRYHAIDFSLVTSMVPKSGTTSKVATKRISPSSPFGSALDVRGCRQAQLFLADRFVEGLADQLAIGLVRAPAGQSAAR